MLFKPKLADVIPACDALKILEEQAKNYIYALREQVSDSRYTNNVILIVFCISDGIERFTTRDCCQAQNIE